MRIAACFDGLHARLPHYGDCSLAATDRHGSMCSRPTALSALLSVAS